MKTHTFIFAICAVSALAFFGCAKKSAPQVKPTDSQNETVSAVPSESETQPEPAANAAIMQETPSAEKDAWSDDDVHALTVLMRQPKRPDGSAMPGENSRTAGLFIFTYREGDEHRNVPAPVVDSDWYEEQKSKFENYQSVKQEEFAKMDWALYASSAASIIAFHEKDTPRNIITILFSADKWKSWNESRIELDLDSLDDGIRVLLSLTCPIGETTGYLCVSYKLEKESGILQGGTLYRTQDLGKSWKRIEFPFGTEEYKDASVLSMSFEGKYGYVRFSYSINDEDGRKNGYFVTKDGGETWIVWEAK